jgi:hypothetical protein
MILYFYTKRFRRLPLSGIPKLLSKTKLMRGYQCLKCIYLTIHHKELEPPVSPEQQALFDQGHAVGKEAQKRFPGGVLIDNKPWDFIGSLKRTRELLQAQTQVIYEAAFEFKGCYARADIIKYDAATQRWLIYEVKSSTKVKEEHLNDVGLQAWIMAKSGLPIKQIHILHINSECRYPDLSNLFHIEDVTESLRARYLSIGPKLSDFFEALHKSEIPQIDIGPQCFEPHECPFVSFCWNEKHIPTMSVFNLPQIKDKKWKFYHNAQINLDQIPTENLTPLQQRVVEVSKNKKRFVNKEGLTSALASWKFPLVFLDFETIAPAIPRYLNTKPYQQVPFQFSAHIWPSAKSDLLHKEYLHTEPTEPRLNLIENLLNACGTEGSIVSYYAQFEAARISELAEFCPEKKDQLLKLIDRMVDPLPLIRDFIYDELFQGSFSLKNVGPALLGDSFSYDDMIVRDGTAAQRAFEEIINIKTSQVRKNDLIQASLDYCNKDTLIMVELYKWLIENSR